MQSFEITLPKPKRAEYVSAFVICCLHIGSKNHDAERALTYRDYIMETPDTYAFNLGDDVENALPGDEKHNSMMWDQVMPPEEQFEAACQYWLPVAKAGKLILTHDSNHWWRSEAKTGISIAKQLNRYLAQNAPVGRAPKWGQWQAMTKLRVGEQSYVLHSWHGSGGGSSPESALRKCREQASNHIADAYVMGHMHRRISYQDVVKRWAPGGHGVEEHVRTFAVTGSFMKWDNGYGERAGYGIPKTGAVKMEFSSKRWDIRVTT